LGLKNPKKGGYEVGVEVRVCDLIRYKVWFFNKNQNGYKKVFLLGFLEDPFKNTC
jgi:hypothetical protein